MQLFIHKCMVVTIAQYQLKSFCDLYHNLLLNSHFTTIGSSNVNFPRLPSRKFVIIRSQAASQSQSLCLERTLSRNSAELAGFSILKFFQYLSLPSASDCSMMKLTIVSFYTICSLIIPKTAIFNPSYFWMTLGIITPGVSMRYIRGLLRILNPPTPLVVQTEADVGACAFLFQRSEILLI